MADARAPDLAGLLARIDEACRKACAHPLSSRKARLVAVLIDDACDEAFDALRGASLGAVLEAEDVLAFRDALRRERPALGLVLDLCTAASGGPRVELRSVAVPIEAYGALPVEDFMVSLYNANTVQRLVIALPGGGEERMMHEVLAQAITDLRALVRGAAP